jgi:hypothetical protein
MMPNRAQIEKKQGEIITTQLSTQERCFQHTALAIVEEVVVG